MSSANGPRGDTTVMTEDLSESVEELRAKLETMKKLMEQQGEMESSYYKHRNKYTARRDSIIDGTFLSAVFGVVFLLIIGVSFHAFQNLYYAILKKFPSKHTEL